MNRKKKANANVVRTDQTAGEALATFNAIYARATSASAAHTDLAACYAAATKYASAIVAFAAAEADAHAAPYVARILGRSYFDNINRLRHAVKPGDDMRQKISQVAHALDKLAAAYKNVPAKANADAYNAIIEADTEVAQAIASAKGFIAHIANILNRADANAIASVVELNKAENVTAEATIAKVEVAIAKAKTVLAKAKALETIGATNGTQGFKI